IVASPGSEIWLCSRRQLIPCCTDKTCLLSLWGMCSVAMVQCVPLLRLHARGECQQCDAPCPRYPQRRLKNGSLRPAKSALNRLLKLWVVEAGLEPADYSVESLRRTKALHILKGTDDLQTVRALLGHARIESTARYLGLKTKADPIEVCRAFDI